MNKTARKIVALTLTLAMMISSVGLSYAESGGESTKSSIFIDMPSNWAAAPLENAVKNGLISGYDTVKGKEISPNGKLTRAEMAAIINRAFGASEQGSITEFYDVSGSKWYAAEIAKAVTMGTFAGSNGTMRPDASITREEAFAVLARAFKIESKKASELVAFSDAAEISSWAVPEVAGLASRGYIAGSNSKLNPKASITRAEFAKIMDNIVKQYIVTAGDYNSVKDGTVVVNVPGVTLSNLTITGDLIIADGVGTGEVSLNGVTVKGNTVIRGGGAHSINVTGNSSLGQVIISKTASGDISIKVTGNAKVENVSIVDGKVYLSGNISRLDVMGDVPVSLLGASIETVNVEAAGASVSLDGASKVSSLRVESTATGTELTVAKGATITNTTLNAKATVKNEGTMKALESNAAGTTLSGNAPATVTGNNPPNAAAAAPTSKGNGGGHNSSSPSVEEDDNPLKVSRTGYELQNYTVSFKPENPTGIKHNILFYSTVGAVNICGAYGTLDDAETANLVAQGKALSIGTGSNITANLPATLSAINGHMFNQNEKYSFYYIYVASVPSDTNEAITISKADMMIHPERGPAALTSIGDGPGKGASVPAGGATSVHKASDYFVQAYIDNMKMNTSASGITTPRLADFSASWQETEELLYDDFYNNGDKEDFESNGLEPVYIPLALDNYKSVANEQYFADLVENCHIAFFFGGAQLRHTRTLLNDDGSLSKVGQASQNVLARGGTVAGSSAGSAVMSGYSYTDGANYSYQPMYWNKSELVDLSQYNGEIDKEPVAASNGNSLYYKSIGVIEPSAGRDALMDSHFDIRGRLGRLLVALRDTDKTGLAIGPDEGTGIRIRENVGTVFGLGGVYIVDAANAVWSSGTGTSQPLSVTGIKLHYLTEGDTYDFATGTVTPKNDKTEITSPGGTVYKTNDAFGAYETSKTILSLADSSAATVTVKGKKAPDVAFANGPTFDITYTKAAETKVYRSDDTYDTGEIKGYLSSFHKTTIINLTMDVVPGHDLPVVKTIASTTTGASIEFNNPLCLGTTTDGGVDLSGSDADDYIIVKDGDGNAKDIVTEAAFTIDGNVLNIELAEGSFEKGDTIQLTTNVKDIYGESVNGDITYWFSGTKWSSPLKVTLVYPSSSKSYRAFIEFSNEIAIGYTDAADDNYYIDPTSSSDVKTQYIEVRDSLGNVKELDSANSFWLDPEYPKEIMIDLDTDNFETGDTMTISTKIKDIYGEGIIEDVTYEYDAGKGEWALVL